MLHNPVHLELLILDVTVAKDIMNLHPQSRQVSLPAGKQGMVQHPGSVSLASLMDVIKWCWGIG